MENIKIRRNTGQTLHMQFKEQLKYQLATGILPPGTRLPSIRRMESDLALNRNTALRVLRELAEEGLLECRPKSGFYACRGATPNPRRHSTAKLRRVTDEFIRQTEQIGLLPVFAAQTMYSELRREADRYPCIAYSECTWEQLTEQTPCLENAFGVSVAAYLTDELLQGRTRLDKSIRVLITSVFHYQALKAKFSRRLKHKISVHQVLTKPDHVFFQHMRDMPEQARVLIVEPENLPNREFARSLRPILPPGWHQTTTSLNALSAEYNYDKLDAILYAPRDATAIHRVCRRHKPLLREVIFKIDQNSIEQIRRSLACT